MKKNTFALILPIAFIISGCLTMDLQPGMSISKVNSEFWVYCNKGNQDGQHILPIGTYEHDPTIQVYKSNASTKRDKEDYQQCEKKLYFQNGLLVSDEKINTLEAKAEIKKQEFERVKKDLAAKIEVKKQLMLDFIEKNNLQVISKFKETNEANFKVYSNPLQKKYYSIDYEFVDEKLVQAEIIRHEQEEQKLIDQEKNKKILEEKFKQIDAENEKLRIAKVQNEKEMQLETEKFRIIAKVDLISQALNYTYEYPEDSSGSTFWYPIKNINGHCIYQQRSTKNLSAHNNKQIDLGKGDPRTVKVTKGAVNVGLFGSSIFIDVYSVSVEGLGQPIASCSATKCDPDRLYRAWNMIYSKCSGRKTNF
jgi:hypothetical protein